jgi:hypothetical protein
VYPDRAQTAWHTPARARDGQARTECCHAMPSSLAQSTPAPARDEWHFRPAAAAILFVRATIFPGPECASALIAHT